MAKRVYEIAKERGLQSQQVLRRLRAAGIDVKSISSTVEEKDIEKVFGGNQKPITSTWFQTGPKTVKKADLEAAQKDQKEKAQKAKDTKSRAIEQAKRLRAIKQEEAKKAQETIAAKAEASKASVEEPPKAPEAPKAQEVAPPTEAELKKRAQDLAMKRVSEAASKRRADAERERLEAAERQKAKAKAEEKPKSPNQSRATGYYPENRSPQTRPHANKGGKRRVVIDNRAGVTHVPKKDRVKPQVLVSQKPSSKGPVTVNLGVTTQDLAKALNIGVGQIIKELMEAGDFVTINQILSEDQIEILALALSREILIAEIKPEIPVFTDDVKSLVPRAAIVTIMGHVDHGKTTLLDAIRKAKVADSEAGGITQHIGAYQAKMPDGRAVTFIDTPGHEAFTALRARGAAVTDVAVLVVAADDGVRPQTEEAINHAKAAGVPIVVAINKIDKENANVEKVKSELSEKFELIPEEWGGQTVMVEVSAKKQQNLDELIELLLLQADILELKANPDAPASGYIIESRIDIGRGPVATFLVKRGTLRVGDIILAGSAYGRVRAMHDFQGKHLQSAGPSVPVELIGFDSVPESGEFCQVMESERQARHIAQRRGRLAKAERIAKSSHGLTLEDFFSRMKAGKTKDLNLIVKADVGGSLEAIESELAKFSHEEVSVKITHSGVGGINESDIDLASVSGAIVIGFSVRPNAEAKELAARTGVEVKTYRVIYNLKDDIEKALSGMLAPEEYEEVLGEAEVRLVFSSSKSGAIAGCMVSQGRIVRGSSARILRGGTIVHEGEIGSIQREKESVREVSSGFECGIVMENFSDIQIGDRIECFAIRSRERTL